MSVNNTNTTLNGHVKTVEEGDIGFGLLLLIIVLVDCIVPNLIACIARMCMELKEQRRNTKELESNIYVMEDI